MLSSSKGSVAGHRTRARRLRTRRRGTAGAHRLIGGGLPLRGPVRRDRSGRSGPWCSTRIALRQSAGAGPSSSGIRLWPSLAGSSRPSRRTSWRGRRSRSSRPRAVGGNTGPGDHERDVDVGVKRGQLARHQAVLAGVQAVVGAEHDVGVVRHGRAGAPSTRPISRPPPGLTGPACGTRCRSGDLLAGQRRVAGQPVRRVGGQDVEAGRAGAARPGK